MSCAMMMASCIGAAELPLGFLEYLARGFVIHAASVGVGHAPRSRRFRDDLAAARLVWVKGHHFLPCYLTGRRRRCLMSAKCASVSASLVSLMRTKASRNSRSHFCIAL